MHLDLGLTRLVAANLKDGFILFDGDDRIREVNNAFCAITGYERSELIGSLPPHPFLQSDDVGATGELGANERQWTIQRKDGGRRRADVSVTSILADDGRFQGRVAFVRNATPVLNGELQRLDERRRIAAEAAAGVGFDWDLRHARIERSAGLAKLLGFRADEADPTHEWWLKRIHPDDLTRFSDCLRDVLSDSEQRLYGVEYRVLRKDGTYRWIHSRAAALRDEAGRPTRVIGSHTDVTDRKNAENALRENEERLRAVFEQSTAGIAQLATDGRFVLVNQYFCDMVGRSKEELLSMLMQDITHPEDVAWNWEAVEKAKAGGGSYRIEKRYVRPDGSVIWADVSSNVLWNSEGKPQAILGVITDITDRKRVDDERNALLARERAAHAEVERANQAKDEFLAVLSHELRTPLTPVLTSAQMMERDETLTPDQRETAMMIRRNVELEARLIDDLLDLTRISHGKLELFMAPVDIHAKIQQVAAICDGDLRSKRLLFKLDLAAKHSLVQGDGARLQQAMWNLLKNAVKFTPEGGSVTIRTQDAGPAKMRIQVVDTGCGVAPEVLPAIFDAFVQGGREVTRRHGGLGLGLAISKRLVELHGGVLTADSQGEGKGCVFNIELPTAQQAAIRRTQPSTEEAAHTARRADILLVEDNADTSKAMKKLLQLDGHRVRTADSVATALRAADAEPFDLLISDIGLPDGTGLDLMRQLRAKRPVKAIALSGFGMEEDIRRSKEAGFTAHLIKPVSMPILFKVIEDILL